MRLKMRLVPAEALTHSRSGREYVEPITNHRRAIWIDSEKGKYEVVDGKVRRIKNETAT